LAKTGRKKGRVSVKEMRFRNDPMIRFYEKTQEWLQERGRPLVIAIGVIAGIVVLYVAGYYYFNYRETKAATAFSQALEKYNAPVQDPSQPSTTPVVGKTYTDETTKWQESSAAFEQLASDYSGYYGTIGRYYAGVSYLHLKNTDKGLGLLQQAADASEQPTSDLARLAIAEYYATSGQADKAIPLYKQSLEASSVLRPAIQVELGKLYEKTGDTQAAVEAYFEAAKANRSAPAGQKAEERLKALAPDRLVQLPPPTDAPVIP
jgi:predicted negative regulator of RcsB-dependent stress response